MAAIVELPVVIKSKAAKDATAATAALPARRVLDVRFPDRCVYCSVPAEGTTPARVTFRPARDQAEATAVVLLPYCARHRAANRRITRFNNIAAGLACLAGAAGALYVARLVDVIYLLRPLVVLVAAAPLIVICLFLWSVLRSLLGRFSRSIRHTGIRSATLGFRVDYSKADHVLRFKLLNLDYAERFARLNKSGAG
jgi:hypothetical protein